MAATAPAAAPRLVVNATYAKKPEVLPSVEAGVESKPADPEENHAKYGVHLVVSGDRVGAAVSVVFADPRFQQDGGRQSRNGTLEMNNGRPGKVLHAEFCQPAAAPYPVADDRINDNGKQKTENDVNGELCPLGKAAPGDGQRHGCESELEQKKEGDGNVGGKGIAEGISSVFAGGIEEKSAKPDKFIAVSEGKSKTEGPKRKRAKSEGEHGFPATW